MRSRRDSRVKGRTILASAVQDGSDRGSNHHNLDGRRLFHGSENLKNFELRIREKRVKRWEYVFGAVQRGINEVLLRVVNINAERRSGVEHALGIFRKEC